MPRTLTPEAARAILARDLHKWAGWGDKMDRQGIAINPGAPHDL